MIFERIQVGTMEVNCYILAENPGAQAIIIDPGDDTKKIQRVLDKFKLIPAFIINTHGHYDHIGSDDDFGVPVYVHKNDSRLLQESDLNFSSFFSTPFHVKSKILELEDGQVITLGQIKLKVIHTPGHTLGGISLLMLSPENNILFTGDSLFNQSIGRSDLPGGNQELLVQGIKEKLFCLPDETSVYPGHGEPSSIGEEKKHNPYLS